MGQAVDLPDPTTQTPAPVAASSADDLLSQLAGDEIDRLLAESDAESAAQAEAQAAAPVVPAPVVPDPAVGAPAGSTQPYGSGSTAGQVAARIADPPQSSDLGKVLDEAAIAAPPAASSAAETSAASTSTASPAVDAKAFDASLAGQAPAAPTELQATANEIETSLQERSGLTDSTAGDLHVEGADDTAVDDTPVPIYLKPLVWMNAPLMVLPEPLRNAIGKIAFLTLFNAVALLTYVMIFRRHHH